MRRVRQLLKGDADGNTDYVLPAITQTDLYAQNNFLVISVTSADLFKLKAKFPQITPHDVATVLYDFLRF